MSETTLQKLIYKTRAKGMQGEAEKAQSELDRLARLEDGIRALADRMESADIIDGTRSKCARELRALLDD